MSNINKTIITDNADITGNAHLEVEYNPVDLSNEKLYDSNGDYQFETSLWLHSDFYIKHGSKEYSLASKILMTAPFRPRYAEVINEKAYVLAGYYKYPNSENFEKDREQMREQENKEAKEMLDAWIIAEIEKGTWRSC